MKKFLEALRYALKENEEGVEALIVLVCFSLIIILGIVSLVR